MSNDPKVTFELPADYLARFPDGDYTVGRGADPRSAAERSADPDGSLAKRKFEAEQAAKTRSTRKPTLPTAAE